MKDFKEYLLNSKDFDLFARLYTENPNSPAAAEIWASIRLQAMADLLRDDAAQEESGSADKSSEPNPKP